MEKRNAEILQKYYLDSLPLLQANFYSTLIEGRIHEDELSNFWRIISWFLGVFLLPCGTHFVQSGTGEYESPASGYGSAEQVQERLGEKMEGEMFLLPGEYCTPGQLSNENEVSDLTDDCDRFCGYVGRMIGAVVTVGIGQVCSRVLDLASSYTSAREAVSYRVIY